MLNNLAGYEWKAGQSKQVAYLATDGDIHELYVALGGNWAAADLTQLTGAPPVSSESYLTGYEWDTGQSKQVAYLSTDGNIHELYVPLAGNWAQADLTQRTPGAPAPFRPSSVAGYQWTAVKSKQVAFWAPYGGEFKVSVRELYVAQGGSWLYDELANLSGAISVGAPLVGYEWKAGQTEQVVYTTTDGHIHELYKPLGGNWALADLTQRTGAPPASGGSIAAYEWDAGKSKQVVYMTADGHIHELYIVLGGNWEHADLTQHTGAPPASGGSIAAYEWDAGKSKQVVYMTADGHIHELYVVSGGNWDHADLSARASGAPPGALILAGYQWTAGRSKQVVYGTPDGHIHELFVPIGGSWGHADLTQLTGSPPLA